MEKNIDIAVARITPRLSDFTILGLEANYRVNLTSAAGNTRATAFPQQITQGITTVTTTMRENWSAGIAQNLWKGGGNYTLSLDQQPVRQSELGQYSKSAVAVGSDGYSHAAAVARLQD